ncbi:MAG: transposase [Gemmatimonas sp.]|nr:transposase [Gemmatimonas sp.]
MARIPRSVVPGVPAHHIQRGNNRQAIFIDDLDRRVYRELLIVGTQQFGCAVHAWVFMANHVHLLITPLRADGLGRLTQWMGAKYVRWFNQRHGRTGTLWEGRFRSSVITSARYFLTCSRYIDQNPVRAGLCTSPGQFPWSSYACLALGHPDTLVTEHAEYCSLGASAPLRRAAYRDLCDPQVDDATLTYVRQVFRRCERL